jgi:hypothetical protein
LVLQSLQSPLVLGGTLYHAQQPAHHVCALFMLLCCCRRRLPHFSISYSPDFRDNIAKTWPASIDDSAARSQWAWAPKYDLQALADDMLRRLAAKYKVALPPELAEQQGSSGEAAAAGEKPAGAPVAAAV